MPLSEGGWEVVRGPWPTEVVRWQLPSPGGGWELSPDNLGRTSGAQITIAPSLPSRHLRLSLPTALIELVQKAKQDDEGESIPLETFLLKHTQTADPGHPVWHGVNQNTENKNEDFFLKGQKLNPETSTRNTGEQNNFHRNSNNC